MANGVVERLHNTIRLRLSVLPSSDSVTSRLAKVIATYNASPHSSLDYRSPAEVFLSRPIRDKFQLPLPVPDVDVSPDLPTFDRDDHVWLLKPPNERRSGSRFYDYPFRVVECSPYAYKLVRADGTGRLVTATVDRLVLCRQQPNSSMEAVPAGPTTPQSQDELFLEVASSSSSEESDEQPIAVPQVAGHLPPRNRRPPVRFEPGGDPRQLSFNGEGYALD
ncbi:hypothetical protein FOZ60_012704 [Perkinsus olseni]|uniref:Integrase catalytic domain-containing protein n=1 Tax=Perkinsus olseni TaxID=32597 RepID=A0A7J6NC15_PEROL|nr:hypothetical protein FOZ60_012704 [Perkinsus olseni]